MPAPIAFFAYNRPDHTLRTLEALAACRGAEKHAIHFFCDGPRSDATPEDLDRIDQVRQLIHRQQWAASKEVFEREQNVGLAVSITEGISNVLEKQDAVIVVEDDLVVSPGFLEFLNSALERYRLDDAVMHVSA